MKKSIGYSLLFTVYCLVSTGFLWWGPERSKEYRELSRRATVALEKRMWHEALIALEGMKRRYPTNPSVRLSLAGLYREVGLLEKARENAQWALNHIARRKRDLARWSLALIDFEMGLYEEALSVLAHSDNKTPNDIALEAKIWIKKGAWDRALELLNQLPNDNPKVHFWRLWCQYKQGDRKALNDLIAYFPQNNIDAWSVLGVWAAQALKGEKPSLGNLSSLKRPQELDDSQKEAWNLIDTIKQ